MRRLLSILIILFLSMSSFAQKYYEFSNYTDKYTYEIQEFLTKGVSKDKEKGIEELMVVFNAFWNSDTLSETNKMSVIKMSNALSMNRFNASPTFFYFLENVMSIKRDVDNSDNFEAWLQSLEFYVKRKRTGYLHQYMEYSSNFFQHHYIFDKSNKIWKLSHGKMTIKEDDNHNPIFIFKQVDLVGTSGKDSSYIVRTNGTFYPLKQRWQGNGGRFFWTRMQLDTAVVYANLRDYRMDLKTNLWLADSVEFYDYRKFDFPLQGKIRDNFGYVSPKLTDNYPSFNSDRHDLVMKDVFQDVDFQGGYSLQGLRIVGSGEGRNNAYFIFKYKGEKFVWAGSQAFIIEEDKIISEKVSVTIYLESVDSITKELTVDSIYHPGLSMYFSNSKRNLSIYRKEEGLSQTPFFDSYHRIDLYVEELNWNMGEEFIDMKSLQQKGIESKAYFESVNLFSRNRYERLQGLDRINPVLAVYNYCNEVGTDEFYAEDFGYKMRMGKASTIAYLMNLASKGFLLYDVDEDYVIVKENVKTYVLAYKGDTDYDVIGFNSATDGQIPNASLNLRNKDIILQGVGTVFLSDSQDVKIIPKYGRVALKKNRDFEFDGKIMAGRFDLYAKKCYFSYDKFEIDLPKIDSLSFKVEAFEENIYGEKPLVRVRAVIEDLNGNLLIDHPNNKSGRESFPEYPILNSKSKSYVYYDKTHIFNKVYKRDEFFYRLESFSIDSLDDFKTEGLQFEGYLASAGIFPDIEEPLMVQSDYSLGFQTVTGTGGLAIYGGKGRFNDTISLSNSGLRGSGGLNYLTSISSSVDFQFFPDSTNAYLTKYEIEERKSGVEYPPVIAHNVQMHWEPMQDFMEVNTIKKSEPFVMYNEEAKMEGLLTLSSKKLIGAGMILINNAEMEASVYNFNNRNYNSDSCMFRLLTFIDGESDELAKLENSNKYAYETEDMFKANIDFDERKGTFESNGGAKPVTFAENMYICFMDQFIWYMDEAKTEFSSKGDPMAAVEGKSFREQVDLDLNGTRFISTHPNQDSLNFNSSRAVYLQRQKLIHAYGVPFINAADAAIRPKSHELKIFAKAEMEEISDAELLVNTESQYHLLYNGTFKVRGKHNFSGRALYDYKDEYGNIQNIYFGKIETDTAGFTLASAIIEKSANFTLSKYFDFEGGVRLVGAEKYLTFDGGTRINHICDTLEHPQIRFVTQIDPANIKIPITEELKDINGKSLYSGLKTKAINGQVYSVFLDNNGGRSDNDLMQAYGFLIFDNISQEYRIASQDKLEQMSLPGNYLSLSKRDCSVYGEGKLDMVYNSGHLQADAYGSTRYFSKEDSSVFNISIPLDFFFNEKALELFAADLNKQMSATGVNLENDIYTIMLYNKLGLEMGEDYEARIVSGGGEFRKIPKELISTIFISDVKMKYNPRTRSLVSTDQIGIASVGKDKVQKYVDGKMEIQNKGTTFELTLALDLGGKDYYYFEFKGSATTGQVLTYSSNEEYNTMIKETKSDDRKAKTKGKEPRFNYYISTPTAFKKFIRMMEMKEN